MVDPIVAGGILKAVSGASESLNKGLLGRLLGPLTDEIGKDLAARYVDRRKRNAERVLAAAAELVSSADGLQPNMRVLGETVDAGSWCESEVAVNYLAGVLASSRSEYGEDDSALPWARLVTSLSSAELALHYLVYDALRREAPGLEVPIESEHRLWQLHIHLSIGLWRAVTADPAGAETLLQSAVIGLRRVGLLGQVYSVDSAVGARVCGTHAGIELFLRGHGYARPSIENLVQVESQPGDPLGQLVAEALAGCECEPVSVIDSNPAPVRPQ